MSEQSETERECNLNSLIVLKCVFDYICLILCLEQFQELFRIVIKDMRAATKFKQWEK